MSVSTAGVQNNSVHQYPTVSADGRRVVFESPAATLVAGDTNNAFDVFLRDRGAQPVNYCTAGTTSNGCNASIAANANPSVSLAHACNLTVSSVEGQKLGLVFYGINNSGFTPLVWSPGSTSYLRRQAPNAAHGLEILAELRAAATARSRSTGMRSSSADPTALGNPARSAQGSAAGAGPATRPRR